jgi:hypothetical protein
MVNKAVSKLAKLRAPLEAKRDKIKKSSKQREKKDSIVKKDALINTAATEFNIDKSLFSVPHFNVNHNVVVRKNFEYKKEEAEAPKITPQSVPQSSFYATQQDTINKEKYPPGLFFMSPCLEKKEASDSMTDDNSDYRYKMSTLKQYGWGDRWANGAITCKCCKCELKHVVSQSKGSKMFVLVDMDNWGLKQMAKPLDVKTTWLKKKVDNVYVWCFYGAGYRDYLDQETRATFDRVDSDDWLEIQNSVFGLLKKSNHVRLSPTGYHKQSADLSILNVVKMLRDRVHLVVISRDKGVLSSAAKIHDKVTTINPDSEKPFGKLHNLSNKLL